MEIEKNILPDIRFRLHIWLFMCESILMRRTLTISYCSEPVRSSVVERLSVCLANRPKSTDIYGGTEYNAMTQQGDNDTSVIRGLAMMKAGR